MAQHIYVFYKTILEQFFLTECSFTSAIGTGQLSLEQSCNRESIKSFFQIWVSVKLVSNLICERHSLSFCILTFRSKYQKSNLDMLLSQKWKYILNLSLVIHYHTHFKLAKMVLGTKVVDMQTKVGTTIIRG